MAGVHEDTHHMRITSGGQVSIPAAVRKRWGTRRVKIVDAGDHLVIEPEPENPFAALRGRLADMPMSADAMRELSRADDDHAEARRDPAR
jgi:bifunctional DNA-binding transcriptional regulator/antitoxin component of YhaV-PrlF toxin-antitoxin module